MPAAGGDDRKARGARPVDELANERRLVAIGEAVHHAGGRGLLREERTAESIRLDGDHHHVLALLERLERVLDRGDRVARRFDDDVHFRIADELAPVLGDRRALD